MSVKSMRSLRRGKYACETQAADRFRIADRLTSEFPRRIFERSAEAVDHAALARVWNGADRTARFRKSEMISKHGRSCVAILVALAFAAAGPALCGTLVLSTDDAAPIATTDHTGIGDRSVIEAFRRLGLALEIVNFPSERALINANEGVEDGSYSRVEGLEQQYPNLIRVAEELTTFEFVAFSAGARFKTTDWRSLQPYTVGIVTGWKILERNITAVKSLTKVRDEKLLFGLLAAGKADVVVYARLQGRVVLQQLGMRGITELEPPLAVKSMYLYLHKRHAGLVPRLEQTLREMKKDGTMQRIVAEVEHSLEDGR